MTAPPGTLLSVRGLWKSFGTGGGWGRPARRVAAVADVSFDVPAGKTLALVGESGSGKSTIARLVLQLLRPDAGAVSFDGLDWLGLPRAELNRQRRKVGVVFQDPASSLNPRMTVEEIVSEPLLVHRIGTASERRERVVRLLAAVGLPAAALDKRPGEFSGGQRQRIGIARALATEPRFVVLDEPVSALDVSVRAQVLNLLLDLQEGTPSRPAYLFIGHDLGVVRAVAERTAVLYLGKVVEEGPTAELFAAPRHPYTALLLASQPGRRDGASLARRRVAGEPASAAALPPGCPFHPRCPSARPECRREEPTETVEPSGRRFRCFVPEASTGNFSPSST